VQLKTAWAWEWGY